MKLLTAQTAKLAKTQTDEVMSMVLYLDPLHSVSMCPSASPTCRKTCLIHSGMMRMPVQTSARKARTTWLHEDREAFMAQLCKELNAAHKKAVKQGKRLDVRLNGTSDLDWSEIYAQFPFIGFHEYTKRPDLAAKLSGFANVHVTFSRHENHSLDEIKSVLANGVNVAVVFRGELPSTFKGIPVLDGDAHDRRWEDPKGHIVGLKVKGTNNEKRIAIERGFAV